MTILCYHATEPGWQSPMSVEPADFDSHVRWLVRNRTVLPLSVAVGRLDRSGRLPSGSTALTFDDGFNSVHEHAWPVLRRQRVEATVFLVAATLSPTGHPVDWVDTPPSYPLKTLNMDQVMEMQAAGVDFQSHSNAHVDLTTLGFDECVRDLRDSREALESVVGRAVTMLAYPRGRHNEGVRRAAERAGFRFAFSLPERREPPGPFSIPRVGIHRGNSLLNLRIKSRREYLPMRTSFGYAAMRAVRQQSRRWAR